MTEKRPVTRDDVLACYRQFLGREPENEQVVQEHLAGNLDLWDLIRGFDQSDEARRRAAGQPALAPAPKTGVTRQEVLACYRQFLKREPESDEAVAGHMASQEDLWNMVKDFDESYEAARWAVMTAGGVINHEQSALDVDVHTNGPQMDALVAHVEEVWSRYGREDAYYSVLTDDRFRAEHIDDAGIEDFYRSGGDDLSFLRWMFRRNSLELNPSWRVLDLGCGAGRVGEHFAPAFAHYIGVDISAAHLDLAANRFSRQGASNVTLLHLSEFIGSDLTYDLFYSNLVLQHNPPPISYRLLDRVFSGLTVGGCVFFQIPCYLYEYRFNLNDYLAGKGQQEDMEMHALPQKYVFELMLKHGISPIEVTLNPNIGPIGFSYSFLGRKSSIAP